MFNSSIIKKIIITFSTFILFVFINNCSNATTGFKMCDNSPRMTTTVNSSKYDDVIISFRDFSSLDPNKIKFYTVQNGKIGKEITDPNFLSKPVEKHYGIYDKSILVDCIYTISNKYLNQKNHFFYVTVADKYNTDRQLKAFFRINSKNGKYSTDTAPRVKDWKASNGIVSFTVQDWVGINYVKIYDMYSSNSSKVVDGRYNLPKGNNNISFSINKYTKKNGKYKLKIETLDNNKTYKQKAERTVYFELETVSNIKLNKTSLELEKGKTQKLEATVTGDISDKKVTWSSSNTSVATVSNGIVTAKSKGTAKITAKLSNGKSATCSVKVTVTEKEESSSNTELSYGENLAIAACRLSYSSYKNSKGKILKNSNGYYGTKLYIKYRNDGKKPHGCCSRGMSTVVNAYLKYDTGLKKTSAKKQYSYMAKSSKWKKVGTYKSGMENKSNSILKPGDIVISKTHTCMYVGNKIPSEVYEKYLKGTDADYGKPKSSYVWVTGRWHMGLSLCICNKAYSAATNGGNIYRYVGK